MSYLPEGFKAASSNIEPEDRDVENAANAHEEVRDVLEADETLAEAEIDTLLIGSYGRRVSIKRIKDVDVFSMLIAGTEDLDPTELLDHFIAVLKEEYGGRVARQARSAKVDFPDYGLSVDAVPARRKGDHWEIPDRSGTWEPTNPLELGKMTTELNDEYQLSGQGMYVPTVKLVRQVRRASGIDKPSGLYFEILTLHAFQEAGFEAESRAEYLTLGLEGAAKIMTNRLADGLPDPTLPGEIIKTNATDTQLSDASTKLATAAKTSRKALAEGDECASAKLWRELLGRGPDGAFVFPMPEHCEEDGTRAVVGVQAGETRVPRGNDRFA